MKKISEQQFKKIIDSEINDHHYDCPDHCDEGKLYDNGDELYCMTCNGKGYLTTKDCQDIIKKQEALKKLHDWNREQLEKYSAK